MSAKKAIWNGVVAAFALLASVSLGAAEVNVDCAMCHAQSPTEESHPPIDTVSVESCTICHQASGDDKFFMAVHEKHDDCALCHGDAANDEMKAQLDTVLGR